MKETIIPQKFATLPRKTLMSDFDNNIPQRNVEICWQCITVLQVCRWECQKVILYCYSSCSSSYCWGDWPLQKTQGSVVLNRIGMKWRRNFTMTTMTSFHAEKFCRLVSAHIASSRRLYWAASANSWSNIRTC